jgi:signal transduction histidine kinase
MLRTSIKGRLIATVVISQVVLAVGLIFTGVYDTERRMLSTLDATMQSRAMSVAALVRYGEDASGDVYFDDSLMPPSIDRNHPDLFAVWADRTGLIARSSNWPEGLDIPPQGDSHWHFKFGTVHYRGLRISQVPILDRENGPAFRPQTLTIIYAAPTVHVRKEVHEAGIFIALVSLLLLGITVLLALWGIRRGLFPLRHLASQAALVSTTNWELQLPKSSREVAELRPLTESMTTMLARLQRSFEQQREFMGNAAHELKTPVAVLKSTLQSLLHRPRSSDEYRAGLDESLEDLERLEKLLQWMMRLARAEQWGHGALRRDLQVIDVRTTCEEAVERIRQLAEARNTKVNLSTNGPAPFRADPEDLQLVWINLLENALRYSPEGRSVEIAVNNTPDGWVQVDFHDHGVGIPAADLPHIFERFYRGDPSRNRATGGFGLGLAIAKALVEAYGGRIVAESQQGEGTRMTVHLPGSKADQVRE